MEKEEHNHDHNEETMIQEGIQRLQKYEETLQNLSLQKQQQVLEKMEIEEARNQINDLKDGEKAYKLIGEVLLEKDKEILKKELDDDLKIIEVKIKAYEKQEEKIKSEMKELQESVVKKLTGLQKQTQEK